MSVKNYRYLISLMYDGSKFNGFQRLKNLPSIQKSVEQVLSISFNDDIKIKGAGRTDAGVHALDQKAHFDLKENIDSKKILKILRKALNKSIYITECKKVDDNFHARYQVKQKIYEYKINVGEYNPLLNDYMLQYSDHLNMKLIKKASKLLIGCKDFKALVYGKKDKYIIKIDKIKIFKKHNVITIRFIAKSFYRYMVRNLVGALLEIGKEKIEVELLKKMLDGKISKQLPTAPPNGLYLVNIKYKAS